MQDNLRNLTQIPDMIEFVRLGGFWTADNLQKYAEIKGIRISPLMEVIEFPDRYMIHDGHHRAVSTFLGGREFIRGDEYVLKKWTYDDYLVENLANRWVTPFDPRTEVRLADFGVFKKYVLSLVEGGKLQEARNYILANKDLYAKVRTVSDIRSLVEMYQLSLKGFDEFTLRELQHV